MAILRDDSLWRPAEPHAPRFLELVQEQSETSILAAEQIMRFAVILNEYSQRLKRPTAVEEIHAIVDELLTEMARLCAINITLGSKTDTHAAAVSVFLRRLQRLSSSL